MSLVIVALIELHCNATYKENIPVIIHMSPVSLPLFRVWKTFFQIYVYKWIGMIGNSNTGSTWHSTIIRLFMLSQKKKRTTWLSQNHSPKIHGLQGMHLQIVILMKCHQQPYCCLRLRLLLIGFIPSSIGSSSDTSRYRLTTAAK